MSLSPDEVGALRCWARKSAMEEVEPVAPFAMKQMMNKFTFKITRPIKRSADGDNYFMSHEAAE